MSYTGFMGGDQQTFRALLLKAKTDLEQLDDSTSEDRAPVELDQTSVGRLSRVDAMQRQAMAVASQQRRRVELARIESALRRLEEGEFGYCVACGEEIGAKRLHLDPATPTCIACARAG